MPRPTGLLEGSLTAGDRGDRTCEDLFDLEDEAHHPIEACSRRISHIAFPNFSEEPPVSR